MQTKVMVFGTFDLLHAGHENLFQQCKKLGDYIIAVIARDENVKKLKGRTPFHTEKQRRKNLEHAGFADRVILGDLHDKLKVIRKCRPDVIALGYDQYAFTYGLEKFLIDEGMNTNIVRLKAYRPEIYKSSIIKNSWLSKVNNESEETESKPTIIKPVFA